MDAIITKATDAEFEDHVIEKVTKHATGWEIQHSGSLCFWVDAKHGVTSHKGDTARFYGRGLGSIVRGLDLNGVEVFYRTPAEQEQENERQWLAYEAEQRRQASDNRAKRDADYANLPPVFQRRLNRFWRNNPNFWWESEAYELSACVDAVKIAEALKDGDAIQAFYDLDWTEQTRRVPGLFDGHSGNSFAVACRLAHLYVTDPVLVEFSHGALCPFAGCEKYGCAPLPTEEEINAARGE